MLKFDDLLSYVGEFGLYQKRVYLLLCLFCITHGMRMVIMVFILNLPQHRCSIPNYANDTFAATGLAHEIAMNMSLPADDSCHIYTPNENYSYDEFNHPINATLQECEHWVYDTSVFESTVASQLNLVCSNANKRFHATMMFYGGFLIGVFVLGAVSDIIGRKRCLYLSLSLLIILGMVLAFTKSFIAFAVINFFVGAVTTGIFSSAFVIGIEIVGPSKRTYTGMFIQLFFSFGVVTLAGLAYLIRDWRYLQITITAPLVIFYLAWCFIPESPRWQIQRGHLKEARKTIVHAAKVNLTKVPDLILNAALPLKKEEEETATENDDDNCKVTKDNRGRLVDLFKSKVLFFRTGIIFVNWAIVSMTFYGLNFNAGNLGAGSIFLNFFLAGLVEFPAHITTLLTVDRLGRKVVHCGMMITSGVACLLCVVSIVFAPQEYQWLTVALAMLGKFGAAGGFGTIYMYSTEIFPTVIRNSALGASSSWARLGAMVAPYIAAQGAKTGGALGRGVPLLVCGCLIMFAGALSILLPETLNRKLPETIKDAEEFSKLPRTEVETTLPVEGKENEECGMEVVPLTEKNSVV